MTEVVAADVMLPGDRRNDPPNSGSTSAGGVDHDVLLGRPGLPASIT
jgi:hypothetical protein